MEKTPLVFEKYPQLEDAVPFCRLGEYPSRVHRLNSISQKTGAGIWIKRDDEASCVYGGNKCRMMEWIIPDAIWRGRKSLVTWGALGSNQVLGSVIYGKRMGFDDISAVHNWQPYQPYVRRNFLISTALGVKQYFSKNSLVYLIKLISVYLKKLLTGKKPYLVPLLGSSPLSVLSYFDAALELQLQVHAGECPRPDYIYITVGTGGTAAGLILGSLVCGDIGTVIGVRVLERVFVNEYMIAWEVNRTLRYLRRHGVDVGIRRVRARDINLEHGYIGKGYAERTDEGERSQGFLADEEGIDLDVTYTGKTMAAMLDVAENDPKKTFLFWHTLNSVDLSQYTMNLPDGASLKPCFQKQLGED